ncbi:hypothetical protein RJ640_021923 [Escallonia rubra]|uniref:GAG-pre-integrase domain-containing protein n=1 Tax=Escallonia rubra TaxID=112253 RepID=A0AA88UN99_9ASTE|nr:hypothetical protein RJ640_021923 [Escallonia rubra]
MDSREREEIGQPWAAVVCKVSGCRESDGINQGHCGRFFLGRITVNLEAAALSCVTGLRDLMMDKCLNVTDVGLAKIDSDFVTSVGSSNDNSELWHKRLGHLSEGDGSTDEQSLEDPEEHPSDSWNLVRDREPRTKKPTQRAIS